MEIFSQVQELVGPCCSWKAIEQRRSASFTFVGVLVSEGRSAVTRLNYRWSYCRMMTTRDARLFSWFCDPVVGSSSVPADF